MPRKLLQIIAFIGLTQTFAFASTITLNDTINPANGAACNPGTSVAPANGFTGNCIDGAPIVYDIFKVSLTNPTVPGGLWHLEILTNYGQLGSAPNSAGVCPNNGTQGCIPAGSTSIPTFSYENKQFGMADLLIQAGSSFYGIVLTPHDGYAAGTLYQSTATTAAAAFLTSAQVMTGVVEVPRPTLFAELAAGAPQAVAGAAGKGTLTAGPNLVGGVEGDGVTNALYKISVDFAAPVNFLGSGNFTVFAASYVCDNGYMTGTFPAFTTVTPPPPSVPEPSTWMMFVPAAVAIAMRKFRKG